MKAVRGAEISLDTLNAPPLSDEDLSARLTMQDDHRLFTVFEALKKGMSVEEIYALTRIDRFFLYKLQGMAEFECRVARTGLQNGIARTPIACIWEPWACNWRQVRSATSSKPSTCGPAS